MYTHINIYIYVYIYIHLLQRTVKLKPTNLPTHIQALHHYLHSWCEVANICKEPQQHRVNYWKISDVTSHLLKSYLRCSPTGIFPLTAQQKTVLLYLTSRHDHNSSSFLLIQGVARKNFSQNQTTQLFLTFC